MRVKARYGLLAALAAGATAGYGAEPTDAASYLAIRPQSLALRHVEIIDGTGAAPRADQTVIIYGGKIAAVGPDAQTPVPPGVEARDYAGCALLPGLIGMHDHFF